jgi:hypothetical protein
LLVSPPQLRKRLAVVLKAFGWQWHEAERLIYIPSWFGWNEPNGSNVKAGWMEMATEIPSERLRNAVRTAVERRSNAVGTQEQEQEQEKEVPPNPPDGGLRIRPREFAKAAAHRKATMGRCNHDPECASYADCVTLVALELRGEAVSA